MLLIEEETAPPPVLQNLHQAIHTAADTELAPATGLFEQFVTDIRLHALHQRIQRGSGAGVRMQAAELQTVITAVAAGGVRSIPEHLRAALLKDDSAFWDVHVEAQWQGGDGGPQHVAEAACGT